MINQKKVLAYIPIRSGSKGIKDKNIIDVCGKPLVAYTIEAAKRSKYVDRIIVSTDSAKYAEIVEQYGAEAPFLRPDYLATDTSIEIDVCQHMLSWVEENWGPFQLVLKLEATSPLRIAEDIDKAIEKLEQENADTIISVTESVTHPYWMNILPKNQSMKNFIRPEAFGKNRQELPIYYQLDGVVFTAKWDFLRKNKSWFSDNSFAVITPSERALDLDEPTQLDLLRILIKKRNEQTRP